MSLGTCLSGVHAEDNSVIVDVQDSKDAVQLAIGSEDFRGFP